MTSPRNSSVVWRVAVGAFLLKALLATFTVGTNDSLTWDHDLSRLRDAGFAELYRHGVQYSSPAGRRYPAQPFIHPPAMLTALRLLGALQESTGLPLHFWLRIACGFADAGTLVLVWRMFPPFRNGSLLCLLAANPISVLVSGFHGNTDPIMMLFVVATVFLLVRGSVVGSAVAFGFACGVKLVPVIYAPAMIASLPTPRSRATWVSVGAGTWIALSMPYLAQTPLLIVRTILGYGSATGLWGFYLFSRLLREAGWGAIHTVYAPSAKWIAFLAVVTLPMALKLLRYPVDLFAQCGMVSFLFLFLSPGFGLQYLSWTVPWIVTLGVGTTAGYYTLTGAFLFAVYVQASGSARPGVYADLLTVTNFQMLILIGCLCWLAIGAIVWRYALLFGLRPPLHTRAAADKD